MYVVQNRAIHDTLNNELGPTTTKKVYQDLRDHFYLDFAILTCDCGDSIRGVVRMEFYCGLATFIDSIKAIKGVKLVVV